MNYPEGYLSHKITWNDIMPVVSKVKFISKPFQKWLIWKELDNYLLPVYNSLTESDNKGVLVSIINFINWFDLVKPCYQNN